MMMSLLPIVECSLNMAIHVDEKSAAERDGYTNAECLPHELHRKLVAEAFWTAECEAELRESRKVDYHFKCVGDREELMNTIDKERANTTYSHFDCSEECKRRGIKLYLSYCTKSE